MSNKVLVSQKIKVGKKHILAVNLKLSSKNLIVLSGSKGYVMCGYLNLSTANKFNDVAVKITKVSTIKEALAARVHSVSYSAKKIGIKKGKGIKDVLKIIV